ncbi:iron(III) transport system ATP-binding protein [Bacillus pakistanensis]|uniref:Spermidine/putrescine import ATP-binding protein PotA n=1 Tax=Rossellomorea pakistanensis TaxID=992288 RepID=A0ABS2N754_9BACI|nr:ABC transporter ATP-binding protein [Bacillus pakistanensis]MBM7583649.1 iron(III) transport system ATP-binding protein [Bacillus pakistanensis]
MASVELEGIKKAFGEVVAVKKLDLSIKEGEFFTFLGPSGCGKTTTLRMIAGFYYPTEGTVKFSQKDMTKVAPEKRNTGMVFQNYALFPHMTVFENVAFGLKVRKLSKSETQMRVHDVLKKVRLEQYSKRQVSQLSGGQQQRVALARALVIEPDILLLDEPLSNLDARLRDEMRTEILRLQKDYRITTIYVTHDQVEALTMSDRIAVFNFGVCHQIGSPKEIYNQPVNDFVASFIGEINLLNCELINRKEQESCTVKLLDIPDKTFYLYTEKIEEGLPPSSPLKLLIRPEGVELSLTELHEENVLKGTVSLAQFTGTSVNLHIQVNEKVMIKALALNKGELGWIENGTTIWIRLPKEQMRIVPSILGVD